MAIVFIYTFFTTIDDNGLIDWHTSEDHMNITNVLLIFITFRMAHVKSQQWPGQPTIKNWQLSQWTELSYCLMSWERNEISLPLNQQTLRYGRNLNDVICPLLKLNPIIMSLSK